MLIFELQVSDEFTPRIAEQRFTLLSHQLGSPRSLRVLLHHRMQGIQEQVFVFLRASSDKITFLHGETLRGRVLASSGPYFFLCLPMRKRTRDVMLVTQLCGWQEWTETTQSLSPCRSQGQVGETILPGDEMLPRLRLPLFCGQSPVSPRGVAWAGESVLLPYSSSPYCLDCLQPRSQLPSASADSKLLCELANWHLIMAICAQSESWLPRDASPLASFQSDAGFSVLAKMSASDTSNRN